MNKNTKRFIKILFVLALIFFIAQDLYLYFVYKSYLNIIGLELADRAEGGMMLYQWWLAGKSGINLLHHAWLNTIVDFFFIIAYVGMIRIISNNLLKKDNKPLLIKLLRLNMRLAFIIGILDMMENVILLYDITNYYPGEYYISSMYLSYPKCLLIGWTVLVWLVSVIKGK